MARKEISYMKSKFIWVLLLLLMSCSDSNHDLPSNDIETFNLDFFSVDLPKNYTIDVDSSDAHWEYFFYRIKDVSGNQLMFFYDGMQTFHSKYFNNEVLPTEFLENVKFDTVYEYNKERRRYVVLHTIRYPSKDRNGYPLYVEFVYNPDEVNSAVCEKIIRSAKVHSFNKEYSCNVHVAENLIQHGEKISSLREKIFQENITLIKDVELKSKENLDLFEKRGKFLFLADCYMDNDYKGSFYINENCDVEWNGELAEKEDVLDLLNESKSDQKKSLLEKCPDLR